MRNGLGERGLEARGGFPRVGRKSVFTWCVRACVLAVMSGCGRCGGYGVV